MNKRVIRLTDEWHRKPTRRACDYDDGSGLRAPDNMTVIDEREPILYTPDGRALVRKAGF